MSSGIAGLKVDKPAGIGDGGVEKGSTSLRESIRSLWRKESGGDDAGCGFLLSREKKGGKRRGGLNFLKYFNL